MVLILDRNYQETDFSPNIGKSPSNPTKLSDLMATPVGLKRGVIPALCLCSGREDLLRTERMPAGTWTTAHSPLFLPTYLDRAYQKR